jgi:hypothetical protein
MGIVPYPLLPPRLVPWIHYFGFRSHGRGFCVDFREIAEKAREDKLFALMFRQLLQHVCKAGECERTLQAFLHDQRFWDYFYRESNRHLKKSNYSHFFCIFV